MSKAPSPYIQTCNVRQTADCTTIIAGKKGKGNRHWAGLVPWERGGAVLSGP